MSVSKSSTAMFLIFLTLLVGVQILPLAERVEAIDQHITNSLSGKHRIEIGVGLLSKIRSATEVSYGHSTTKSEANGFIGSISYTYWLEDRVSIHVTSGVMDVDAATSVNGSETLVEASTITPLLFGVKYQLSRQPIGDAMRPYISASVGPYFGFASNVRSGQDSEVRSYSEAALGSRIGAGVDLSLGRLFTLGVGSGYHFVSDFSERIGAEKNYSGPDFSLSFGVVFGRGRY